MAKKAAPVAWAASIEQFTHAQIAAGMLPRTIELRVYQVIRFAHEYPDGPASVTPAQTLKYIARQDWAANTRIVVRNALAVFFEWALGARVVTADPADSLPVIKAVHIDPRPTSRALIREAISRAKPVVKLWIRLSADAGLGASEIANIRRRDISEQDGDFTIRTQGRAATTRRTPLPPSLAEDLLARPGDHLFPGRDHGHVAPATISRYVSLALGSGFTSENLRQAYLSQSGVRLTSWREASYHSPKEPELLDDAELIDNKALHRYFRRIEKFMDSDPETAISECKNVVESLAKQILDDLGTLPVGHASMPRLWGLLATGLDLKHSVAGSPESSGLVEAHVAASFDSVRAIRNLLGTGHGGGLEGDPEPVVEGLHARLIFNTTITVCEYVVGRWHDVKGV